MKNIITVREAITIEADKMTVWNFTQDFNNRKSWDSSILDFKILQNKPIKLIWIRTVGGVVSKLKYKLCNKPNKTSLRMYETKSLLIKGGGGSWKYTEIDKKTQWIQTNSLIMRNHISYFLFGWIIKRQLQRNTKAAMKKAKLLIENRNWPQQSSIV